MLEAKLARALSRQTERNIPVVRVLDEAAQRAQEFGLSNTVIALTPR